MAAGVKAVANAANSVAVGTQANAAGKNAIAAGFQAAATNDGAVAVGANTSATNASTALGDGSKATGLNATALGWNANAAGRADVFIGKQAGMNTGHANNNSNIGIGEGAISNVGNTVAVDNVIGIGTGAAKGIQAKHNIALGAYADGTDNGSAAVTTTNNVAIGERTRASGGNSLAIGNRTKAEGQAAIALGVGANAGAQNSFAAGQSAEAKGIGAIAIAARHRQTTPPKPMACKPSPLAAKPPPAVPIRWLWARAQKPPTITPLPLARILKAQPALAQSATLP
ncbi:MAG: hypothetical protein Q4A85_05330 [Kingella sp. (in: b-proteobacteria)]|nr:hypothetical protein [Kingella sp. (in: b-proteobacteria)]MDO4657236.1 hypothetical protein [Kingella sp. (in: b-proteobacteria)]